MELCDQPGIFIYFLNKRKSYKMGNWSKVDSSLLSLSNQLFFKNDRMGTFQQSKSRQQESVIEQLRKEA